MANGEIVPNRMPGSKKNRNFERRNAQTSRAGWRPRQTSQIQLAKDIAESMRGHPDREITHYTLDSELISMVQRELS